MARPIRPSKAQLNALARRAGRKAANDVRLDIHLDAIKNKIVIPIKGRVALATEHLRSTVVRNISIPVDRGTNAAGHVVVMQRSVPGEFPRADTTLLMKTIFGDTEEKPAGVFNGYVGTPLDYGLRLETDTALDRRYLTRTFWEIYDDLMDILSGPIK